MTNVSTNLSRTVSQQPIPLNGRYYRSAPNEQPATKKVTLPAHSSQCACAGCFPDPIG